MEGPEGACNVTQPFYWEMFLNFSSFLDVLNHTIMAPPVAKVVNSKNLNINIIQNTYIYNHIYVYVYV